jgi:hypothetical protein
LLGAFIIPTGVPFLISLLFDLNSNDAFRWSSASSFIRPVGGNAVLSFTHSLDLEGEIGVVARASGTACTIRKIGNPLHSSITPPANTTLERGVSLGNSDGKEHGKNEREETKGEEVEVGKLIEPSIISNTLEQVAPTPLAAPDAPTGLTRHQYRREVHLLTMTSFPKEIVLAIGGIVAARAVKLLTSASGTTKTRDKWWNEVRKEIKSHARSLNCTTVVGYSETTTIFEGNYHIHHTIV